MAEVFISYARSTEPQARVIAEALRARGYGVWRDDALPAHRAYGDVIAEQIEAAHAVVVIWSADAVASEWVRSEADRARALRKLVQLRVDGANLPMPFDQIHCADLTGWTGGAEPAAWAKVVDSIAALAGDEAPRTSPAPRPSPALAPEPPTAEPVLAVLPFDNLSNDAALESLSDGVSEEIIGALGRGGWLKLIGRAASFRYRGAEKALAATALKATHVLDGSVRSAGARVRIAAELTVAATGQVLWSDRYDRESGDLFDLQDEIAATVADALRRSLTPVAPPSDAADTDAPAESDAPSPESEYRQVTVLFVEIDGLDEVGRQLEAAEAQALRRRLFAVCAEEVEAFEGFVEKLSPAGLVALFGAPKAYEDHARRACLAALGLQARTAPIFAELARAHGLALSARMGLNSGEVVVGLVGDDARKNYGAMGRPVAEAQRVQALAQPGSCCVGAATAALVEGYVELEDLGSAPAFGGGAPARLFRLAGLGAARNRFDVARARGLSPFVGRESDLRTLEAAMDQIRVGRGQVIGVVAEAGTGKSRLCFEFLEHGRASGFQVYEARAVAHGRNIPFLPVIDLLRAYLGVDPADDAARIRERIETRLLDLDPAFEAALPLMFDFLGAPDPSRPAAPQPAAMRRAQIISTVRQLVYRLGERQPIMTMIEDLHWMDAASVEFLDQVIDARGARSLLLLNYRPEFQASWTSKPWYRQIPLSPLDQSSVAELLSELVGRDPSLGPLEATIYAQTAGNPFFIEEVVRTLAETGHLEGERGAYRLVTPVERIQVPTTVQAVVAARIDRLSRRDKRLLQLAAVIGKNFPEPLLARVAELEPEALRDALANLQAAEFIVETSVWPEAEFTFRHPLTQEVALGSQLMDRRRRAHAAVAEAIEAEDPDRRDAHAALIATHWSEGGDARKAATWWLRAARLTANRFAATEAVGQIACGIAETHRLPEGAERWQTELELQVLGGALLTATDGHGADSTANAYLRALALCEKLPSSPHRMAVEYGVFTHFTQRLDMKSAGDLAEAMVAFGDRERNAAWRFTGFRAREILDFYCGRFDQAVTNMRQSLIEWHAGQAECGAFLVHDPGTISLHCYASFCLTFLGRLDEARLEVEAAHVAAFASGHPLMVGQDLFTQAVYRDSIGDWDLALPMMQKVVDYSIEHDVIVFRHIGGAYLATLLARFGEAEPALELVKAAVSWQRTTGNQSYMPGFLARQGELMTRLGRAQDALPIFDEAVELMERSGARWDESAIRLRRSRGLTALGQNQAALAELRRAHEVAVAQGGRMCEIETAAELARVLAGTRQDDDARALVRQALAAFPGERTGHLDRARACLAEGAGAAS
jgi:TolB-like protein/tetratricopeptide (TPR) repeat protein